jgi:hypothetical protein
MEGADLTMIDRWIGKASAPQSGALGAMALHMHTFTGMRTPTGFRTHLGGLFLSLTLSGLCACAPDVAGPVDDGVAPPTEPTTPAAPSSSATESATSDAPAPAAPAKEIVRISLYTASGTYLPPREGFQADIANGLDAKYFDWIPIDYPATMFPMGPSIDKGVAKLIEQIKSRPGKFALVGYSQGGIVISTVYNELRFGSLQDRRQDLVAGVALGNPMREAGHIVPGGSDPGGHGIMAQRLVNTEPLWWEICNRSDIACTVPDNALGRDYSALFTFLLARFTPGVDPVQLVVSAVTTLSHPLVLVSNIAAIPAMVGGVVAWLNLSGKGPHVTYPVTTPIPGDSRNSIQVAVDYLNGAAATAQ